MSGCCGVVVWAEASVWVDASVSPSASGSLEVSVASLSVVVATVAVLVACATFVVGVLTAVLTAELSAVRGGISRICPATSSAWGEIRLACAIASMLRPSTAATEVRVSPR